MKNNCEQKHSKYTWVMRLKFEWYIKDNSSIAPVN